MTCRPPLTIPPEKFFLLDCNGKLSIYISYCERYRKKGRYICKEVTNDKDNASSKVYLNIEKTSIIAMAGL